MGGLVSPSLFLSHSHTHSLSLCVCVCQRRPGDINARIYICNTHTSKCNLVCLDNTTCIFSDWQYRRHTPWSACLTLAWPVTRRSIRGAQHL
ncbi:hypothetical protein T440DRAFT_134397 [Plenodomus tracheiphilus IPT5]|uniref:Uncharacterized protein n=1 Tax=Plenodomus tracheiphilus IPT5 TaxID=1408161 RepID=A0A6A7B3T2_9PLEO|nr:hypothetical protein T440DRAFT_134397 [Plenodomus tracheiphilus IPT5]